MELNQTAESKKAYKAGIATCRGKRWAVQSERERERDTMMLPFCATIKCHP